MRYNLLPITLGTLLAGASAAQNYQLVQNYSAPDFFDHFDFFDQPDPTNGFVKYQNLAAANSTRLAGFASSPTFQDQAYLGVDFSSVAHDGQPSTRIQSKDTFEVNTLWITDIRHNPGGICGVWSAYWLNGPNWPWTGEIDIMENVNKATVNKFALHTGVSLEVSNFGDPTVANVAGMNMLGTFSNLNCSAFTPGNIGCVIEGVDGTFGSAWNAHDGGIIATELLPEAISVWQFSRSEVPDDISSGAPNPSGWRTPDAHFMSADGSSLADYFKAQQMIFNIDICGSWIDQIWSTSECASLAPTCSAYAEQNPQAFEEAYWLIGGVQIYQPSSSSSAPSSSPPPNNNPPPAGSNSDNGKPGPRPPSMNPSMGTGVPSGMPPRPTGPPMNDYASPMRNYRRRVRHTAQ